MNALFILTVDLAVHLELLLYKINQHLTDWYICCLYKTWSYYFKGILQRLCDLQCPMQWTFLFLILYCPKINPNLPLTRHTYVFFFFSLGERDCWGNEEGLLDSIEKQSNCLLNVIYIDVIRSECSFTISLLVKVQAVAVAPNAMRHWSSTP